MNNNNYFFVLLFLIVFQSCLVHANLSLDLQRRFFPQLEQKVRFVLNVAIDLPANLDFSEPSIDKFNKAVGYNKIGIEQMNAQDYFMAEKQFAKAIDLAPTEIGFWTNRLAALEQVDGSEKKRIAVAKAILALSDTHDRAAYVAGTSYDELGNIQKAVAFLKHAIKLNENNPHYYVMLAQVFNNAGYLDDAVDVLKQNIRYAKDHYNYYYLTAHLLFKQRKYDESAIYAQKGLALNPNAQLSELYAFARYYSGRLDGLINHINTFLNSYTYSDDTLRRIQTYLGTQDYRFREILRLDVSDPSKINQLSIDYRLIPNYQNQQIARLVSVESVAGNTRQELEYSVSSDNKITIALPDIKANQVEFIFTWRVRRIPLLLSGVRLKKARPDINSLKRAPGLSLDYSQLIALSEKIQQMPGDYVRNAVKVIGRGLNYKENYMNQSVKWALNNPDNCDCTEYSALLAALCLANDIPARVVDGFLVKSETLGKRVRAGHKWTEVYLQDTGWIPIDATLHADHTWAHYGNLLSGHIIFSRENIDGSSRVGFSFVSRDENLSVNMHNYYKVDYW